MKRKNTHRIVHVFRYDPTKGEEGRFDRFEIGIEDESLATILDLLLKIQKEQDSSLAFRYACRISMCGSCAMVINGKERLACKTVVADLKEKEITVRPLNHFPIIKDLVVNMDSFFQKYEEALPFFHPAEETVEPAVIRPDSRERKVIGLSTECIACGCCVSSCSMVHHHENYGGPAALNRAFTLLADSRDGLRQERMSRVRDGCYLCRTELNCTEVCPKEISPTRAIKHLQREACFDLFRPRSGELSTSAEPIQAGVDTVPEPSRRRFLKQVTYGLGGAISVALGGVLVSAAVGPSLRRSRAQWVSAGPFDSFASGEVSTVNVRYRVNDGFYESEKAVPILVATDGKERLSVFNSRCTHLGCTVHWDPGKRLFLCACHGGAFNPDGSVNSGPPPRPLDRMNYRVEGGSLLVEVV